MKPTYEELVELVEYNQRKWKDARSIYIMPDGTAFTELMEMNQDALSRAKEAEKVRYFRSNHPLYMTYWKWDGNRSWARYPSEPWEPGHAELDDLLEDIYTKETTAEEAEPKG